jgi:hypothetical protein
MRCLVVIFLLGDLDLTASALSILVLLLEDTVGRMSHNILLFVFVDSCMPLAIGAALVAFLIAACFFCACVLQAGVSLLGADLTADRSFLCCFDFFFPAWFASVRFFSTLGDSASGTLRTCCVGAPMDWVTFWFGSDESFHRFYGAVVGGTVSCACPAGCRNILSATAAFFIIALSVSRCNCFIPSTPFSLLVVLIVFAHLAISAMILSACVIVNLVMFLWLKCAVSVSCLLCVSLV